MISAKLVYVIAILSLAHCDNEKPTQRACTDLGVVQLVQIFSVEDSLVVVWQPPPNSIDCDLLYRVELDNLDVQTGQTDELHYTFNYTNHPCITAYVTITPLSLAEEPIGDQYVGEYFIDFGPVTDFQHVQDADGLTSTWQPPTEAETCDFVYRLEYTQEGMIQIEETRNLTFTFNTSDLTPCTDLQVSITPTSHGNNGTTSQASLSLAPGAVQNFALSSVDGEILITFDPPANSDACAITYEIVKSEIVCLTRGIFVTPITSTGITGVISHGEVETELMAVQSLLADVDGTTLSASWDPPMNAGECDITYNVNYTVPGDTVEFQTNGTQMSESIPQQACFRGTVSVSPVSVNNNTGVEAVTEFTQGVGSIENLQVSEDNFVVTTEWDVPENSELCELTYLVEYTDGPLVYLHVTVDTMFIFELQNCGPYRVTVTPFDITGVHGEEREVTGNTVCAAAKKRIVPVAILYN